MLVLEDSELPGYERSPRWENGYIESFQSRLRDELLERVEFADVADARAKAFWYRREYHAIRPHSSLRYATRKEFSAA
ncbi:MAG: integrase core domain-containing protein [Isosphaeraceae bacterium]